MAGVMVSALVITYVNMMVLLLDGQDFAQPLFHLMNR
jgi:hypothetical protein